MTSNDAIRKIKKLMRVSDPKRGATSSEIEIALAMIDRLMREHNLHSAQVSAAEDEVTVSRGDEFRVSKGMIWHQVVSSAIGKVCDCLAIVSYSRYEKSRKFTFLGVREDIEIAMELFQEFLLCIELNSYSLFNDSTDRRSYCTGYAYALTSRADAMIAARKSTSETSLIFIGKKALAIKKHLKDEGVEKSSPKNIGKLSMAFHKGEKDGRECSLDKKKQPRKLQGDLL